MVVLFFDVSTDSLALLGGSLATCLMCLPVDFKDSIFLASCLTFLAGNLSRSMIESLMVLETHSSLLRKTRIYHNARYFVSGGYLAMDTWACTVLYHSSTD